LSKSEMTFTSMITGIPGVKLGIWVFVVREKALRNVTKITNR
jgi:hypothetical protein